MKQGVFAKWIIQSAPNVVHILFLKLAFFVRYAEERFLCSIHKHIRFLNFKLNICFQLHFPHSIVNYLSNIDFHKS